MMEAAPNIPGSSGSETPVEKAVNKYLITRHILALVLTILTVILCVVPADPITVQDIWTCSRNPDEQCYYFMVFPTVFGCVMILFNCILLTWRFLEEHLHAIFGWAECFIECAAAVCWFVAGVLTILGSKEMMYFEDTGRYLKRDIPRTWAIAIVVMFIVDIVHWIGAIRLCYLTIYVQLFAPVPIKETMKATNVTPLSKMQSIRLWN